MKDIPTEVTVIKEGHHLSHRLAIHLLIRDKYCDERIEGWERSPVLMGIFLDRKKAMKMLLESEMSSEYHTMRVCSIRLEDEDREYLEKNLITGLFPHWKYMESIL